MSSRTRAFFENLKRDIGESLKDFWPDVGAEMKRLGRHGSVELAQALFNGAAFTPYGPGAYSKESKEMGMKMDGVHGAEQGKDEPAKQEQERGGMGM